MKAIIICHEGSSSIVMDRDGDFRLVQGHTDKQAGTEVDIEASAAAYYILCVMQLPTRSGALPPTRVYFRQAKTRDERLA